MDKQLLVTLVEDNGLPRAHYVMVSGRRVLSKGECAPGELPRIDEARAVIFSRGGYFDRAEVEVRNIRTLPFQARRIIGSALAFNEPFKVRYDSVEKVAGRYRLDLVAAPDGDIRGALETLPITNLPFTRLVLAETAIAALVGAETSEPARVMWMRGGVLVGMLVEQGVVLARSTDRPAPGETDIAPRLVRVRGALDVAARRLFPEREVPLLLVLGDLHRADGDGMGNDRPSQVMEARLARRFSGVDENFVLAWPELFGLITVLPCYSLLEAGYQEEAIVSRYAKWAGIGLLALGLLMLVGGYYRYSHWKVTKSELAERNTRLTADYAAIKNQLPSPEMLAILQQRINVQNGLSDFRVDSFLSWVSRITPEGALVRRLAVSKGGTGPAASPPEGTLSMTIEWEVAGDYATVERMTAGLLARLGDRAKLSDSKLEYLPDHNAKFTTVLAPVAGAFR